MDLRECRERLDEIDRKIVELYCERMDVCGQVAMEKMNTGREVYDPAREKEKLDAVAAMVEDGVRREGVRELFSTLMSVSRKLQYGIMEEKRGTAI